MWEKLQTLIHATKKNYENFEIKNLGECHDLYFKINTLLLADFFEKMFLEIYHLDPAHFLSDPGLA